MKWFAVLAMSLLVFACNKQGPLERAGEKVDRAVEDLKGGPKTIGDKLDDAADDVSDAAKKVNKDLKD